MYCTSRTENVVLRSVARNKVTMYEITLIKPFTLSLYCANMTVLYICKFSTSYVLWFRRYQTTLNYFLAFLVSLLAAARLLFSSGDRHITLLAATRYIKFHSCHLQVSIAISMDSLQHRKGQTEKDRDLTK